MQTVEYDPAIPRWYVRFGCDGRDAATIYFDLHQRTLRYEVYFLPDPPANHEALYRFLLAAQPHDVRRATSRSVPTATATSSAGRCSSTSTCRSSTASSACCTSRRAVVPGRDPHRLRPRR